MAKLKTILLLAVLTGAVIGVRAAGLADAFTFEALGAQQAALHGFVAANPVAAPLAYLAVYVGVVTLSLPVGVFMSAAAGLLFGVVPGCVYAVGGAEAGAISIFLLARTLAGGLLQRRAAGLLERVRPALQRDGFNALLALRLLPVVPFWVVNLAAAVAGMRLLPYAAATLLGIAPTTAVLVSLGAGLGQTLAAGQRPDLRVLFHPAILLPLVGLAALAAAPMGWRWWQRRRHA